MTNVAAESQAVVALEKAERQISTLLRESESAISIVATGFEELARQTEGVLKIASEIVGCIEGEEMRTILPRVQQLGEAAQGFIHERLQATTGVLETAAIEARQLEQLSQLTRGQRSIARETQTLSVLTNIEVARLGQLGAGFQYLARQLDEFSQSVAKDTKELASHTDERKTAIDEARRRLAAGLPKVQKEFARIEADLSSVLAAAAESERELARAPEHFQAMVKEIAGQIAGVVAAVQGHDITRQQLEHVQEGVQVMAKKIRAVRENAVEAALEQPLIHAGLAIQCYQLHSIERTVGDWIAQIGRCAENILRISASEVVGMGPSVMAQESRISAQLTRIEHLEEECNRDSAEVLGIFSDLTGLMQLVGEHVDRSRIVRDRLQLLTFNSIIEARNLGTQADAILEISQCIKRISGEWSDLTDRSAQSKEEILRLVEQTSEGMKSFSEGGNEALREAQKAALEGLAQLRKAADFAARRAAEVEAATSRLQAKIAEVGVTRQRMESCFAMGSAILGEIEEARRVTEAEMPGGRGRCSQAEAEALYGGSYTTEIEREVLRAALSGAPLPVMVQNLEGNDVELF